MDQKDNNSTFMDVDLPIDSVVVYRSGANITRKGKVSISENSQIKLQNLPLILDDSSIRIKIEEKNIIKVKTVETLLELPKGLEVFSREEEESLKALHIKRDIAAADESSISWLIKHYKEMAVIPAENNPDKYNPSPLPGRMKFYNFICSQLSSLNEKRLLLLKQIRDFNREILELEGNRNRVSNSQKRRDYEIKKVIKPVLDFSEFKKNISGETEITIILEYLIPGARWTPLYNLDFQENFSKCEFKQRAMICQKTGEDWNGVTINLSTAEAWAWTEIPELKAKIIGRQQAFKARKGWREPPADSDILFQDFDGFVNLNPKSPEAEHTNLRKQDAVRNIESRVGFGEVQMEYDELLDESEMADAMPCKKVMIEKPKRKKESIRNRSDMSAKAGRIEPLISASEQPSPAAVVSKDYSDPGNLKDYDFYRLYGYNTIHRNILKPISSADWYMESLTASGYFPEMDIFTLLNSSVNQSNSVTSNSLPSGCVNPFSINGYDYVYEGSGRIDIPSDGQFHVIPLEDYSFKSDVKFVSVPRESSQVYRSVSFINKSNKPFIQGPCDISLDGLYLLSSSIQATVKDEKVVLGLGVEEGIKISRNTNFEEKHSGLLNGNLGLCHEIKIDVSNNLKFKLALEIRERIPVPHKDNEKTKIIINSVTPKWDNYEYESGSPLKGGNVWNMILEPGESINCTVNYEIQIPANSEIVNGNRREK